MSKNLSNVSLFSLSASRGLAEEIAEKLGLPISKSEVAHFTDGEVMARPLDHVRGKKVYVVQSTSAPVSEHLMELMVFLDGLKNASAKEINIIIPYYGYCRQDRMARLGEPITARLVADLLHTAGATKVITVDLHTPQIQGFFSCPVDDLSPISLFGEYYREKLGEWGIKSSEITVVSPDHGSIHRARDLASELPDSSIAIIDKRRPAPNKAEVVNLVGDIKGRTCILVDDIVDTAGTILSSVEALKERGAKNVALCFTHAVLSDRADKRLKEHGLLDIVTTNSIEGPHEGIAVISLAKMISELIVANETGGEVPSSYLAFY